MKKLEHILQVRPFSYEDFLDVVRQIDDYWLSFNIAPIEMEIRYG